MLSGQAAIDHLATEAIKEDECASSHWQRYHSKFKFDGSKFSGLQGFGGFGKRHTGFRLWSSRLLQRRFRRYADGYGNFCTIDDLANKITLIQSREYDLDVLRQALTLSFLHSTAPDKLTENKTSCVIGDGFATMATLLVASKSAGRVVLVNLTKTLLVDLWYLQLWMGPEEFATSVGLVTDEGRVGETGERGEGRGACAQPKHKLPATSLPKIIAIQASDHQLLRNYPIDLFINSASMQEMDPPVVSAYFDDMRAVARDRDVLFYCCNRQQKTLPDGVVSRFADYPWHVDDHVLVDGLCPWHQHYYSIRPPFYRPYDGPILHRLATLSP